MNDPTCPIPSTNQFKITTGEIKPGIRESKTKQVIAPKQYGFIPNHWATPWWLTLLGITWAMLVPQTAPSFTCLFDDPRPLSHDVGELQLAKWLTPRMQVEGIYEDCGHCNEELPYSAYRSHRALYYVESEGRWLSQTKTWKTAINAVVMVLCHTRRRSQCWDSQGYADGPHR